MRLIDADRLKGFFKENLMLPDRDHEIIVRTMVDSIPTAYDVDKVVEQLETKILKIKKQLMYTHDEDVVVRLKCKKHDLEEALEIVKEGGTDE